MTPGGWAKGRDVPPTRFSQRIAEKKASKDVAKQKHPPEPVFHLFSELPSELQDLVWEHAIQNVHAEPEAHFFNIGGIVTYFQYDTERSRFSQRWSPMKKVHGLGPACSDGGETSKQCLERINSSGFNMDSALWFTSIASRQALVRRWDTQHKHDGKAMDIIMVRFKSPGPFHDAYRHPIVMRPNDLIICHIPCLAASFRLLPRIASAALPWGFDRMEMHTKYLAIECDPSWTESLENTWDGMHYHFHNKTKVGGLIVLMHSIRQSFPATDKITLGLIDHQLKANMQLTYEELVKDCKVFRACGKRYIMIDPKLEHQMQRWSYDRNIPVPHILRLWEILVDRRAFLPSGDGLCLLISICMPDSVLHLLPSGSTGQGEPETAVIVTELN